jgi:WD40 repeat protein/glycosyltransferase involved in cell wall biosynthesis
MGPVVPLPPSRPEVEVSDETEDTANDGERPARDGIIEPGLRPATGPAVPEAGGGPGKPITAGVFRPLRRGAGTSRGIGFRAPGLPALPEAIEITLALRPLLRRVPVRGMQVLDEEETVKRIVEERICFPVFAQGRSRWAELALVVDGSPSMDVWEPTIAELRRLLEWHGAFRDVRIWRLDTTSSTRKPNMWSGSRFGARGEERSAAELQDPGGRRLILLVSDCVAPGWRGGRLAEVLRDWGRRGPLALLQALPPRMWPQGPLGLPALKLSSTRPGVPNSQLRVETLRRESGADRQEMPIPVLSLDPASISRWARVVAGQGGAWVHGVRLSRFRPPPPETLFDSEEEASGTREPPARELAVYLTTVDLTLPVMRLVQQLMLPNSLHMHLAEVLLSGLLRRTTPDDKLSDPDDVEYEFADPEIPEILLEGRTGQEVKEFTARVIAETSRFLASQGGRPTGFDAALRDVGGTGPLTLPLGSRPFAMFAAPALRRYGGEYAALAERLERGWETAPELDLAPLALLRGHAAPVGCFAWSPNGELLASPSLDGTIRIWTVRGEEHRVLEGHAAGVNQVSWSPDGQRLASCSSDGTVRLWDTRTWSEVRRLDEAKSDVISVDWSSDGAWIASGTAEGRLSVWPVKPGRASVAQLRDRIQQVTWSGDWIAVAIAASEAVVWDARRWRAAARFPKRAGASRSVAWSWNGELLLHGKEDGEIMIWRVGRIVSADAPDARLDAGPVRTLAGHESSVVGLSLDRSEQLLASKSLDGTVRLWRTDQWRCVAVLPEPSSGGNVAFHPRLRRLAIPGEDGSSLRLWDVRFRPRGGEAKPDARRPRILMLMWEIPPLVAAGVWTACYHLVRNLRERGADVTVVAPWNRRSILPSPFGREVRVVPLGITPPSYSVSTYGTPGPRWSPLSVGAAWSSYGGAPAASRGQTTAARPRSWSSYGGAPAAWSSYGGAPAAWSSHGGGPYGSGGLSLSGSILFRLIRKFQQRLQVYVREHPTDLIHAHDWVTFDAARTAATQIDVPWVAHFHSVEADRRPERGDPLIERIEQGAVNTATRVVAPSRFTKTQLITKYNAVEDRIDVIPNVLSQEAAPASEAGRFDTKRVIFLGRLAYQKGIDRFCDLADTVRVFEPEARFEVFGDGAMHALLRDHSVTWRGLVGWDERGRAFRDASVVVVPSRAEPFGMVILEAMNHRVPVVYPAESGAAEILRSGLQVRPDDLSGMADHVVRLLRSHTDWDSVVHSQCSEIEGYVGRAYESRLITLWEEAIAGLEAALRNFDQAT